MIPECHKCKVFFHSLKALKRHQARKHPRVYETPKENCYCERGDPHCLDQNCGCVNNRHYRNKFKEARKERKRA